MLTISQGRFLLIPFYKGETEAQQSKIPGSIQPVYGALSQGTHLEQWAGSLKLFKWAAEANYSSVCPCSWAGFTVLTVAASLSIHAHTQPLTEFFSELVDSFGPRLSWPTSTGQNHFAGSRKTLGFSVKALYQPPFSFLWQTYLPTT